MTATVVIYTRSPDPYSVRAKKLLEMKGIGYVEKPLPEYANEMHRLTGSTSTPQILINGVAIGSFDALGSLELRGELDKLLGVTTKPSRKTAH